MKEPRTDEYITPREQREAALREIARFKAFEAQIRYLMKRHVLGATVTPYDLELALRDLELARVRGER